ncbi:hypothetical protein SEA_ENYGMA_89 [Streptomyces phage Enygma]
MILKITVPAQEFEYDIPEYVAQEYRKLLANPDRKDWELDDFWDTWSSDTWPEMELEVIDDESE